MIINLSEQSKGYINLLKEMHSKITVKSAVEEELNTRPF